MQQPVEHSIIEGAMAPQRSPRVPFVRLVQLLPIYGAAPRRLWFQNVSMGGAFIRSSEPLPVGTKVRLRFATQAQKVIELGEATVRWNRTASGPMEPSGFGVQFLELSAPGRSFLEALISVGGEAKTQRAPVATPATEVEPPLRAPGYKPPLVTPPPAAEVTPPPEAASPQTSPKEADTSWDERGRVLPFHKVAGGRNR